MITIFDENTNAKHVREIYPRYSSRLLKTLCEDYLDDVVQYLERTGRAHYNLSESFLTEPIAPEDLDRIRGKRVVCMSLHFKASNFARRNNHPTRNDHGQIPLSELNIRNHRAWEGSPRFEHTFMENYVDKSLNSDFGDWVPVVYLANDLLELEPVLRAKNWVVIRSKHNSLAHCPGAMWRYLGFNLPARCAYMQDTDRPFNLNRAKRLFDIFEKNPQVALVRPLQWSSPGGEMAIILGNDFLVRPEKIDFDAAEMMLGYLVLNILHEDRLNNFVHEPKRGRDDKAVQAVSKRLEREHFGPMPNERVPNKNYPYYAFDEQWLREFVYYHLSDGRMATLLQNLRNDDLIQRLDLEHQTATGNVLVPC